MRVDDEGGVESQHSSAIPGLAVAYQLNVTHVMHVKSEVGDLQVKPGTAGLKLVFETENQRVYQIESADGVGSCYCGGVRR
jgi:hypothetical protein